jgi:hypothetical protein
MSLEKLFEGVELTDEAKETLTTIHEAAVSEKVALAKKDLEEGFETKLEESKKAYETECDAKIEEHLSHATDKWLEENKLVAIDSARLEISESFIDDLKVVFENHNIDLPEAKVDALSESEDKVEELTTKLDEATQREVDLKSQITEMQKEKVVATVCEGLKDTDKERMDTLIEGISFTDSESYTRKLNTIKESFLGESEDADLNLNSEVLEEGLEGDDVDSQTSLNEENDDVPLTEDQKRMALYLGVSKSQNIF